MKKSIKPERCSFKSILFRVFFIVFLSPLCLYAQDYNSIQNDPRFIKELNAIRAQERAEYSRYNLIDENGRLKTDVNSQNTISSIRAVYTNKENELINKYTNISSKEEQQGQTRNQYSNQQYQQEQQNAQAYQREKYQNQQYQQQQSQQYIQNLSSSLSGSMNSLMQGYQASAMQHANIELNRRQVVATNFFNLQNSRINRVLEVYKQIPSANFNLLLNGYYKAHFIEQKKYSFSQNQDVPTETECIIQIENNIIKNIYLYGKKGFEIQAVNNIPIRQGIGEYLDYDNLKTYSVILIEPYLNNQAKNYSISNTDTGYITIWSSDRKNQGKTIYIQELDSNGNIIREISTNIIYAKNEKELNNTKQISINTGNKLLFFCEPKSTPFGVLALYPNVSNKSMNALKNGEIRYVKIKDYR